MISPKQEGGRWEGIYLSYLDLFLFHLELFLEFARVVNPSQSVNILWWVEFAELDVAETKVLACQLFLGYTFGPI